MSLDNVTLRAATLDDLTGIAAIYNQLWCNTLRNRGDVEAADFCARFNIAMQLQRSPIALVAEARGPHYRRLLYRHLRGRQAAHQSHVGALLRRDARPGNRDGKDRRCQARGLALWRQS